MTNKINIDNIIGNTPLLKLSNISSEFNLTDNIQIFTKIEFLNPAGSIKDRAALQMINDAEDAGLLCSGATIIEPTSGNTGIGLAAIATVRGYKTIIVMPDNMSKERIDTMRAYGAEVVLTSAAEGMAGSIAKAEELADSCKKSGKNAFIPDQFNNKSNAKSHYLTTGPEIYKTLDGKVDVFVAGIGTGGTITGVGQYLKEQNPKIKIVGMEPASSPILTAYKEGASIDDATKASGTHKIQGIGANFVPSVLDLDLLDDVIQITDDDAYEFTRLLAAKEGIFAGISSGANVAAAVKIAEGQWNESDSTINIVTVLPDGGSKYMSSGVFD